MWPHLDGYLSTGKPYHTGRTLSEFDAVLVMCYDVYMILMIPDGAIDRCRRAIADPTWVDPAEMECALEDLIYGVDDHLERVAEARAEALRLV